MRTNFFLSTLCVVIALNQCSFAKAFRSSPTQRVIGFPSNGFDQRARKSPQTLMFAKEDDPEESEKLEEDNDPEDLDDKDLPMFQLEYNPNLVDYNQLPVPPFTSAVVFFISTFFTIYLYYVGITGGVAPPPPEAL